MIQHLHVHKINKRRKWTIAPPATTNQSDLFAFIRCELSRHKISEKLPTRLSLFLFDYSCQGMISNGIYFCLNALKELTVLGSTNGEIFCLSFITGYKSGSISCCMCTRHFYCKSFPFRNDQIMQNFLDCSRSENRVGERVCKKT